MRKHLLFLLFLMQSILPGLGQSTPTYTIGILSDNYPKEMHPVVKQLQETIIDVVGKEANIRFNEQHILINQLNAKKAVENYNKFIRNPEIDIILAFGPINNYVLMQKSEYPKPVILFGSLNQDFIQLPKDKKVSGIHNLTYLITPESIKEDLQAFHELFPYQNVGIVLNQYLIDMLPVKKVLDESFAQKNANYYLFPIQNGLDEQLQKELDKVDAVYFTGGMHLNSKTFDELLQLVNDRRLPSFSGMGREGVMSEVLFSHSSSYKTEHFIRRIALTIEAIVMGKDPKDIPIFIDYTKKLTFNAETALQIDFPIRYSQLLTMEVVGDIRKFPAEKRFTLPEVIEEVLNQNFGLRAEKKNIFIARKDFNLAWSNYLPNLTASAQGTYIDPDLARISNGSNPEYSTSGRISFEQILYSEEATANISIQKQLHKASRENFNAIALDAVLDGSVAYFSTLIAKTNFIIQEENLRLTRRNYEIANQNYSAGQSGKADVLRWKSELARATQNVVSARQNLLQSYNSLNETMGQSIDFSIDVQDANLAEGVFTKYDYQKVYDVIDDPILRRKFINFLIIEAKTNAPELKALDYNIKAAKRTRSLYLRNRILPTIALQGQYNRSFSRDGEGTDYPPGFTAPPEGSYNLGVSVSLPLFQRYQRNLNRQKSRLQEEQLKLQRESVELILERNVNDIVQSLVDRISNIQISKVSAEAAKESLELTQTAYSSGAVSITSLIDAQRAYIQAQEQQANATYNYLINMLQMERIMGYFFMLHTTEENQAFGQRFIQYGLHKEETK